MVSWDKYSNSVCMSQSQTQYDLCSFTEKKKFACREIDKFSAQEGGGGIPLDMLCYILYTDGCYEIPT